MSIIGQRAIGPKTYKKRSNKGEVFMEKSEECSAVLSVLIFL